MPTPFVKTTNELLRIIGRLSTAGLVLQKLMIYTYAFKKYGNPWPNQGRMAMDMGMPRRTFAAAIAKLQQLGYVKVEKSSRGTFYVIEIPVTELVGTDIDEIDLELSTAEDFEATVDPAPIKKMPKGKKEAKVQLYEQFKRECDPGLNPHVCKKAFMALKYEDAVMATSRIAEYSRIYSAASVDKRRYFTKAKNWLAEEHFRADAKVWRERAGITLRASSSKQQYGLAAKAKRQRI